MSRNLLGHKLHKSLPSLIMFVAKDLESKIQDDLWLDQECYPETEVENFMLKALLKGHCHGDFAIFSSKWLKYLTRTFFLT